MGEFAEALRCYTHSLRLTSSHAVVYANRAMCQLKLKRYRLAVADCDAAIAIDDGYTKACLRRPIAHWRASHGSERIGAHQSASERIGAHESASVLKQHEGVSAPRHLSPPTGRAAERAGGP